MLNLNGKIFQIIKYPITCIKHENFYSFHLFCYFRLFIIDYPKSFGDISSIVQHIDLANSILSPAFRS